MALAEWPKGKPCLSAMLHAATPSGRKPYQQCGREKTDHERGSLTCATELITTTTTHVCTARPRSDQRVRRARCNTRRITRATSRSQPRGYRHAMQRAPAALSEEVQRLSATTRKTSATTVMTMISHPSKQSTTPPVGPTSCGRRQQRGRLSAWQPSDAREPLRRYGMRRRCGRVFPASSE